MSLLSILLVALGVSVALLIVVILYRSSLEMHEDDQNFLSEGEKMIADEQAELLTKITRLNPFVRGLQAVSGILFLVIGAMVITDMIQRLQ